MNKILLIAITLSAATSLSSQALEVNYESNGYSFKTIMLENGENEKYCLTENGWSLFDRKTFKSVQPKCLKNVKSNETK